MLTKIPWVSFLSEEEDIAEELRTWSLLSDRLEQDGKIYIIRVTGGDVSGGHCD